MKVYRYPSNLERKWRNSYRIQLGFLGLGFTFFLSITVFMFSRIASKDPLVFAGLIAYTVFVVLIVWVLPGWWIAFIESNRRPQVTVTETGVQVEFRGRPILVPWGQIVEVREMQFWPFVHYWAVRTRKLTPFHRVYGPGFRFAFPPCFQIHPEMINHEDLIRLIEQNLSKSQDSALA